MSVRHVLIVSALLLCAFGAAFAQTEWTLEPEGPILEPASPGAWDDGFRYIEAVLAVDGVYHMFYRGQTAEWGPFAVGHATSTDGVSWQLDPSNPVLTPGSEDEWDRGWIWGAAVIHDGSQFRLWYAAVTVTPSFTLFWHGVGHATSVDGSSWLKAAENPIIRPGSNGTFIVPQTVVFDGDRYRMWYVSSTFLDGKYPVTSEDGMIWSDATFEDPTRLPTQGLSVVFTGTDYFKMAWSQAAYNEFIWGAASPDGYRWANFVRYPLIFFGLEASPSVLYDNGVFEMWFSRFDGIYRATSTCCSTVYTWFIPAAAHGEGASGTFYRTEVDVNNAGDETADYRFVWFPRDQDNSEWHRSEMFQLEPGRSVRSTNVLAEVFGLGPGSFGALAVEATTEDLLVVGRISTSDEQTAGSYGQSIPAIRVDEFYGSWSRVQRILFGTKTTGARFNVSCFHGQNGTRSDLEIHVFEADGTLLDTRRLRLQPFGSHQINQIFSDHGPVNGYVEVTNAFGTYCFGSLIDNRTNDPTTIPPM